MGRTLPDKGAQDLAGDTIISQPSSPCRARLSGFLRSLGPRIDNFIVATVTESMRSTLDVRRRDNYGALCQSRDRFCLEERFSDICRRALSQRIEIHAQPGIGTSASQFEQLSQEVPIRIEFA